MTFVVCPRAEGLVGEEDVFCRVPQAQLRVLAHGAEPIRDADGPFSALIPLGAADWVLFARSS